VRLFLGGGGVWGLLGWGGSTRGVLGMLLQHRVKTAAPAAAICSVFAAQDPTIIFSCVDPGGLTGDVRRLPVRVHPAGRGGPGGQARAASHAYGGAGGAAAEGGAEHCGAGGCR